MAQISIKISRAAPSDLGDQSVRPCRASSLRSGCSVLRGVPAELLRAGERGIGAGGVELLRI